MSLLAVDPGNIQSAYVVIDEDYKPIRFAKLDNWDLMELLDDEILGFSSCYIEMIGHYGTGMAAGKTVFDTCLWIGRFLNHLEGQAHHPELILRPTVKTHITGQSKAKDANVIQALIDRFAPDTPNRGKGSKAEPGFFYGFKADVWQSYALAVYALDIQGERNV